jgi:hypothetical protein
MKIIFYSSVSNEKTEAICDILKTLCHHVEPERHCSLKTFESGIWQTMDKIVLVILYVATNKDCDNFIALKDRLKNLPVILIIDDADESVMGRMRILRPRFIFSADDNIAEMGMIFEKMIAKQSGDGQGKPTVKDA